MEKFCSELHELTAYDDILSTIDQLKAKAMSHRTGSGTPPPDKELYHSVKAFYQEKCPKEKEKILSMLQKVAALDKQQWTPAAHAYDILIKLISKLPPAICDDVMPVVEPVFAPGAGDYDQFVDTCVPIVRKMAYEMVLRPLVIFCEQQFMPFLIEQGLMPFPISEFIRLLHDGVISVAPTPPTAIPADSPPVLSLVPYGILYNGFTRVDDFHKVLLDQFNKFDLYLSRTTSHLAMSSQRQSLYAYIEDRLTLIINSFYSATDEYPMQRHITMNELIEFKAGHPELPPLPGDVLDEFMNLQYRFAKDGLSTCVHRRKVEKSLYSAPADTPTAEDVTPPQRITYGMKVDEIGIFFKLMKISRLINSPITVISTAVSSTGATSYTSEISYGNLYNAMTNTNPVNVQRVVTYLQRMIQDAPKLTADHKKKTPPDNDH